MEELLLPDFIYDYESFGEGTNIDGTKAGHALIRVIKIKEKCIVICAQKSTSGTRTIIDARQDIANKLIPIIKEKFVGQGVDSPNCFEWILFYPGDLMKNETWRQYNYYNPDAPKEDIKVFSKEKLAEKFGIKLSYLEFFKSDLS